MDGENRPRRGAWVPPAIPKPVEIGEERMDGNAFRALALPFGVLDARRGESYQGFDLLRQRPEHARTSTHRPRCDVRFGQVLSGGQEGGYKALVGLRGL